MSDGLRSARGRIIALPRMKRDTNLTALAELRTYWEALMPAPGVVPPRLAVQPRAIESALHAAFLVERVAPGQILFRVAGRNLVEALGTEPRNLPLTALLAVEGKLTALDALERVFSDPAIVDLEMTSETARGRLLLMPLTDYMGQVTMALGGFAFDGQAPGAFGQFTLRDRQIARLPRVSVTQPGCFAMDGILAAAEAPAPFRGAPRLVHSRDD